jgi:hypothetical protein
MRRPSPGPRVVDAPCIRHAGGRAALEMDAVRDTARRSSRTRTARHCSTACVKKRPAPATFVHPFDDPAGLAGAGTVGLEIVAQVPDVECVLVPIGGGELLAGVASAVNTPSIAASWASNSPPGPAWPARRRQAGAGRAGRD